MKQTVYFFLIILVLSACIDDNPNPYPQPTEITNEYSLANQQSWQISSTPRVFQESDLVNDLGFGYNRAKISWNVIDQSTFYGYNNPNRPTNISDEELSNHQVRYVLETEVFPNHDIPSGTPMLLPIFNLNFFPDERGPYNYETNPTNYSAGINSNGSLNNPETRWGGIMANIPERVYDFNYLDFWLMDPFISSGNNAGKLIINMGTISEDVLRDNKHSSESGINLLWFDYDTTNWGIVMPDGMWIGDSVMHNQQDYGLDGLNNSQEQDFFEDYLNDIQSICNVDAYQRIYGDPSGDDYHPYNGDDFDSQSLYGSIVERYKKYNGYEGNTQSSVLFLGIDWYKQNSGKLDSEDINEDMSLNTQNTYFEYAIDINPTDLVVGENYIDSIMNSYCKLANGEQDMVSWYHFKVPIEAYTGIAGNIIPGSDLETIRIYLNSFDQDIVLRFATLALTEE